MANEFVSKLFGLDGQVAVVIGGTGVLGGALCDGLAAAGAFVVVAGRGAERGKARVEAIKEAGGDAAFLPVDVMSRDSLEKLLGKVVDAHGGCHMLVNCFGVNSATPYHEIEDAEFSRVIAINLDCTHIACQIFGKFMGATEEGGSILNIGSVSAHLPLSRVFAYSASKAAVVNYTKNIAREFASANVRVNCLCPGFFPAEQNRKILDESRVESILCKTPMYRFGEPEELVGAALLLLSREAGSFMTGATVYVDGGFTGMSI
ncbi:MAG: SDR family oxidoreductase [Pirellulales bacterium]|nr:SDR family oxidoreductase [Pirellulales bacterium]